MCFRMCASREIMTHEKVVLDLEKLESIAPITENRSLFF